METIVQRRSRMRRQSTGKRIQLTTRDLEIFKLLRRYRYLRSTFIHAFVGGDRTKLIERLGHLYHEGRYINRPAQQWDLPNARYQPVVYELDDRGAGGLFSTNADTDPATFLGESGVQRQFSHALLICETIASIELGVRENPALRFVTWREILDSPRCPDSARASSRPFEFAVPGGGTHQKRLLPDGFFGIEYAAEGRKTYRFFALEADRATMPVRRADLHQSSYLKKLREYQEIATRQLYRTQFGLPNLFVLTVTTGDVHMRAIMAALGGLAADTRHFLFKMSPGGLGFGKPVPANSHMLSEPWERLSHAPLAIGDP